MKHLENTLGQLGLTCNEVVLGQFERYRKRVLKWNEAVNLTAIKDPEEFEIKHFSDSLMICSDPRMKEVKKILDLGTGAGFPGIPLAIVYPDKKFTLVDSLGKKMKIVAELASEIGLKNVEVIHARAEELANKKEYREQYDLCVSRAVANLAVLSEYCIPFVRVGGWFAPYKTSSASEEIQEGIKAVTLLGGKMDSSTSFSDMWGEEGQGENRDHLILWIEKTKNTLAKYPRKPGTPSKEPLK